MLKFYLILFKLGILFNLVLSVDIKTKEKVYYKHTELTAAVEPEAESKDAIPYVMESQPPSSESIKLNSVKINSIQEIKKKEGKTKPRKGVSNKLMSDVEKSNITLLDFTSESSMLKKINSTDIISQSYDQTSINTSKILTNNVKSNITNVAPVNEVVQEQETADRVIKIKTVRKPKPKPEVTVGEKEADEPIPASPTIKAPLGMPRKIDYIVPIAITITALPLLGAAFYVLYKRGRDYWDKRHYRRMDFLIDGMYNE